MAKNGPYTKCTQAGFYLCRCIGETEKYIAEGEYFQPCFCGGYWFLVRPDTDQS